VIYRIQIEGLSGRRAASDPKRIARVRPVPAATQAPHWWSHVLRPLQGPPPGFK
jgi:hypothetical protein